MREFAAIFSVCVLVVCLGCGCSSSKPMEENFAKVKKGLDTLNDSAPRPHRKLIHEEHKSSVPSVTDANFNTEVLGSKTPVLVDFWAPWCHPCVALTPTVEQLAAEHGKDLKVVRVNIDECPQTAGMYQIRAIPALMVFKAGRVVDTIIGAQPKANYDEMLAKHI